MLEPSETVSTRVEKLFLPILLLQTPLKIK
jgi:hypothetical protein